MRRALNGMRGKGRRRLLWEGSGRWDYQIRRHAASQGYVPLTWEDTLPVKYQAVMGCTKSSSQCALAPDTTPGPTPHFLGCGGPDVPSLLRGVGSLYCSLK